MAGEGYAPGRNFALSAVNEVFFGVPGLAAKFAGAETLIDELHRSQSTHGLKLTEMLTGRAAGIFVNSLLAIELAGMEALSYTVPWMIARQVGAYVAISDTFR